MNKKAIVVVSVFPPPIGGVSIHSSRLTRRLELAGWTVERLNIALCQRGATGWVALSKSVLRILRRIGRGEQLLWHVHSSRRGVALVLFSPLFYIMRQSAVLSLHTGDYAGPEDSINRLIRTSQRLGILSGVLVMNESTAVRIRKSVAHGALLVSSVSPFISEPFDQDHFADLRAAAAHSNVDSFRISTMGLWRTLYRFEDVIEATSQFAASVPGEHVYLDIIASTAHKVEEYKQSIASLAKQKERANLRIRIVENIQNAAGYFCTRNVLLRAAETDSFGLCLAEALQAGCAAIATNVCSRPRGTRLVSVGDVQEMIAALHEARDMGAERVSCARTEVDGFGGIEAVYTTIFGMLDKRIE